MIEITAKQLYDMYEICINNPRKRNPAFPAIGWQENFELEGGKKVTFFRKIDDDKKEWKPTTDLIIKA